MSQAHKEYPVENISRPPIHPGKIFAEEVMPELRKKRTIGEIGSVLGVSRQNLYRVMAGEVSITPDTAARIGALVGNGTRVWLAMRADYDAWKVTKRLAPTLKKIRAEV
ncbi:MAG: HigA family addiction module antitoxin [Candidatus Binataceae bacterium]|jgi:addiction module HigA family antidote